MSDEQRAARSRQGVTGGPAPQWPWATFKGRRPAPLLAGLVLVAGLAVTVVAAAVSFHLLHRRARAAAVAAADRLRHDLADRMARSEELLRGAAGLFAATGGMESLAFSRHLEAVAPVGRFPGLRAVEYARLEPATGEGRSWRLSVEHVTPLPGNEVALGLDLASEPRRRHAVELARDLARAVVTAPLDLVQGSDGAKGFLHVIPVHDPGPATDSTEDRRRRFRGVVLAVFDFRGVVLGQGSPGWSADRWMELRDVTDGPAGEMAFSAGPDGAGEHAPPGDPVVERSLVVGTRSWVLRVRPAATTVLPPWILVPVGILVLGTLGSAFLAGRARASVVRARARETAQALVAELARRSDDLRVAAEVFSACREGIVITERTGTIVAANAAFLAATGYALEELVGQNPRILQSRWHGPETFESMWSSLRSTGHWEGEIWDRRKDGELLVQQLRISASRDGRGEVTHYVGISSDVTSLKRREERLEFLATHDPLTRLPNRSLLLDRLARALVDASARQRPLAVLVMDLDDFKPINDQHGHVAGDRVLQRIAERLTSAVGSETTVARMGGDEFALVVQDLGDAREIGRLARSLLEAVTQPLDVEGHVLRVGASIGISLYPLGGVEAPELLRSADEAMYQAKRSGRSGFQVFGTQAALEVGFGEEDLSGEDLRDALRRGELLVHYQPWLEVGSGRVLGVEALLRWRHAHLGLLPARRFRSLLLQASGSGEITEHVLRESLQQLRRWRRDLQPDLLLAFNASSSAVAEESFCPMVSRLLVESGVPAAAVTVEVSAGALREDPEQLVAGIRRLSELGLRTCLEGLGATASWATQLRAVRTTAVKVAGSLVRRVHDEAELRLLREVIAAARSEGREVLAEGVETREQLALVVGAGCAGYQGFAACEPSAAEAVGPLLRQRSPAAHATGWGA